MEIPNENSSALSSDKKALIIEILNKPRANRTDLELNTIFQLTKDIAFFYKTEQNIPGEIHRECCQYMSHEYFESGQAVFQMDTLGDKFYIIMDGSVDVLTRMSKPPGADSHNQNAVFRPNHNYYQFQDLYKVKTLFKGDSFGELALLYQNPRAATIVCKTECHFGVLKREYFDRILKNVEHQKIEQSIEQLQKMWLFTDLSYNLLQDVHLHGFRMRFLQNEMVFNQGTTNDCCYVIMQGEFSVIKKLSPYDQDSDQYKYPKFPRPMASPLYNAITDQTREQYIKIFILNSPDIFGEEDILAEQQRSYSVYCESPKGEVIMLQKKFFTDRLLVFEFIKNNIINRVKQKAEIFNDRMSSIENSLRDYKPFIFEDRGGIRSRKRRRAIIKQQQKQQEELMNNQSTINHKSNQSLGPSKNDHSNNFANNSKELQKNLQTSNSNQSMNNNSQLKAHNNSSHFQSAQSYQIKLQVPQGKPMHIESAYIQSQFSSNYLHNSLVGSTQVSPFDGIQSSSPSNQQQSLNTQKTQQNSMETEADKMFYFHIPSQSEIQQNSLTLYLANPNQLKDISNNVSNSYLMKGKGNHTQRAHLSTTIDRDEINANDRNFSQDLQKIKEKQFSLHDNSQGRGRQIGGGNETQQIKFQETIQETISQGATIDAKDSINSARAGIGARNSIQQFANTMKPGFGKIPSIQLLQTQAQPEQEEDSYGNQNQFKPVPSLERNNSFEKKNKKPYSPRKKKYEHDHRFTNKQNQVFGGFNNDPFSHSLLGERVDYIQNKIERLNPDGRNDYIFQISHELRDKVQVRQQKPPNYLRNNHRDSAKRIEQVFSSMNLDGATFTQNSPQEASAERRPQFHQQIMPPNDIEDQQQDSNYQSFIQKRSETSLQKESENLVHYENVHQMEMKRRYQALHGNPMASSLVYEESYSNKQQQDHLDQIRGNSVQMSPQINQLMNYNISQPTSRSPPTGYGFNQSIYEPQVKENKKSQLPSLVQGFQFIGYEKDLSLRKNSRTTNVSPDLNSQSNGANYLMYPMIKEKVHQKYLEERYNQIKKGKVLNELLNERIKKGKV